MRAIIAALLIFFACGASVAQAASAAHVLAQGNLRGQACCDCTDSAYDFCVGDKDCAEMSITPGREAEARQCYATCYNQSLQECHCSCSH